MHHSRLWGFVLVASWTTLSHGQDVTIKFPQPGTRVIWFAKEVGAPPANAVKTSAAEVKMDFHQSKTGDKIIVWNQSTNNMAIDLAESIAEEAAWEVSPEMEEFIGEVRVRLEHGGKPLSAGMVESSAGNRTWNFLLTPKDAGTAHLYGVPPGSLRVLAKYSIDGKMKAMPAQTFALTMNRGQVVPTLIVSVPEQVETVSVPEKATPQNVPPPPKSSGTTPAPTSGEARSGGQPDKPVAGATPAQGPTGQQQPQDSQAATPAAPSSTNPIVYVISMGIGAAVIYGLYRLLTGHQEQVANQLRKLGVPVPEPTDDLMPDAAPQAAPQPTGPAPQIILNAAQAVTQEPIVSISTDITSLIGPNQMFVALPEGSSVIGRDAEADHAFPGEASMSRRHAQLTRQGGQLTIEDLNSTNGTFVNGERLEPHTPRQLFQGDSLQFGTAAFRVP